MTKTQNKKMFLEVADTPSSLSMGLMFRKYLGDNSGMIFCFNSSNYHSFWMKNTPIPLDIAFLDEDFKIVDIQSMDPLNTRSVTSKEKCVYAIEMNRGWFENNEIDVGKTIGTSNIKESQKNQPSIYAFQDFKTSVSLAYENKWNLLITYKFKPVVYRNKVTIQRDGTKPSIGDYELILNGSCNLGSGKVFEYKDAGNGEYIVVPCKHSSGEPRCFFIDGIVDFRFFSNGKVFVDPKEIEPLQHKRTRNVIRERDKNVNKSLEGIPSVFF